MLLPPWAGLEGGHATPHPDTRGQSRRLGSRAGASEGQARWPSGLSSAPTTAEPQGRAGPPAPAALVPTRANHGVQPGSSPATRSGGHRSGLCHPPLGGRSSLVPTVERKAAHPWSGSPTLLDHVPAPPPPSPLPDQLVCIPPPNTYARPPPSGATRKPPQLLPGAAAGQAEPSTERPRQSPTHLEVKAQAIWGEGVLVERASALGGGSQDS